MIELILKALFKFGFEEMRRETTRTLHLKSLVVSLQFLSKLRKVYILAMTCFFSSIVWALAFFNSLIFLARQAQTGQGIEWGNGEFILSLILLVASSFGIWITLKQSSWMEAFGVYDQLRDLNILKDRGKEEFTSDDLEESIEKIVHQKVREALKRQEIRVNGELKSLYRSEDKAS